MHTTIVHQSELSATEQAAIQERIPAELVHHGSCYRLEHEHAISAELLFELRDRLQMDINTLPDGFDPTQVKLVISDMDSTFINIECIDEIADFAGVKPQVSAVTEAAMRGELNFEESLNQRVALLKDLHTDALQKVYDERLLLNPGAEVLLQGLKRRGIPFALVSGGFTFFTDRLKQRYQLDFTRANTLERNDERLTGKVVGEIVGAGVKREYLLKLCAQLAIQPSQVIAMGDGANDLLMMQEAGLSVAYCAKPTVKAQTSCVLDHTGLNSVLDLIS
ncbi:MAG: phosphoserine phosphatase SerB [Gammaproteobacteria bacterium]|nr:phosphoserine phosphatase SerB [Gammaproteobacteria bacterium]